MGLRWDPPNDVRPGQSADLDALCVLFAANERVLEVIRPGHPRSVDGSVIHTGGSRSGASEWDDERIFVFLDALPEAVSKLSFLVLSVTGRSFDTIPAALCHISDRISEAPRVRVDLTALCGRTAHAVAVMGREAVGWRLTDVPGNELGLFAELHSLVRRAK